MRTVRSSAILKVVTRLPREGHDITDPRKFLKVLKLAFAANGKANATARDFTPESH
jgi:hypothetical protein